MSHHLQDLSVPDSLCSSWQDFFKEAYGFGPGIGGLVYLGLGGGFILATLFGARFADQVYHYVRRRNACIYNFPNFV